VNDPGAEGAAITVPALPDLNHGQYGWDFIQGLVDRAAWLNMFAEPDIQATWPIQAGGGSQDIIGMQGSATLRRFEIDVVTPNAETGVRAANRIGQAVGSIRMRWLTIPEDFEAGPNLEPPPTPLDPGKAQRFAMLEGRFTFGDGCDGFSSFGTGRTFPGQGQAPLTLAAISNIIDGFGKFSGLEGTIVTCGHLTPAHGFQGDILVRIVDPQSVLAATGDLPPLSDGPEGEPGITYLSWRSQKSGPEQLTTYDFTAQGQVRGLNVPQELVLAKAEFAVDGSAGVRSRLELGAVIGNEVGYVTTNPLHPDYDPGTAVAPARFQGVGVYRATDAEGNEVGGFTAQFLEGRTFFMQLVGAPGQVAARFGFFGPILYGTGVFEGVDGMLLGNTGVAIAPHVFSNLYLLRLHDPRGKFRAVPNAP
jgi:hypothetical protein